MTWVQTYTGRAFDLTAPHADDVSAEDIAHSLAMQCRYNGHTRRHYSVAEHCCHIHDHLGPDLAIAGLLHDAAEAYLGDPVWPLKAIGALGPEWHELELKVEEAIAGAFCLDAADLRHPRVKSADRRILLDERAALLGAPPRSWELGDLEPLGCVIHGWDPGKAKSEWLARLTGQAELFG